MVAAWLPLRSFYPVGCLLHELAEAGLRHKGGEADESVLVFHLPVVADGEGEGGVAAFVVVEVVVGGERSRVFAPFQIRFPDFPHAFPRCVENLAREALERSELVAPAGECSCFCPFAVEHGYGQAPFLGELRCRLADDFRLGVVDDGVNAWRHAAFRVGRRGEQPQEACGQGRE